MKVEKMNIQEKVKFVANSIEKNDNGIGFSYFEEMLDKNDSDYVEVKSKLDNLISLLEKAETEGTLEEVYNLDFETEIWNLI